MQRSHHSEAYHTSAPSFHTAPKSPVSTTCTHKYIELFSPCQRIVENVVMKLISQVPSVCSLGCLGITVKEQAQTNLSV